MIDDDKFHVDASLRIRTTDYPSIEQRLAGSDGENKRRFAWKIENEFLILDMI